MLDPDVEIRIAALLRSGTRSAADAHRALLAGSDGEAPIRISYEAVRRCVAALRSRPADPETDVEPASLATRILSLLDRELHGLERSRGKLDLDRLDRIAATLRRVEPIRPKVGNERASSLRSLLPEGEAQASRAGIERSSGQDSQPQAPASLAAFAERPS
jgi:hypothetical protein